MSESARQPHADAAYGLLLLGAMKLWPGRMTEEIFCDAVKEVLAAGRGFGAISVGQMNGSLYREFCRRFGDPENGDGAA